MHESDEQPTEVGEPAVVVGEPNVGESLGRYVVLEEAGRGGMGRVLRAYDPKLQREVALKELTGSALAQEARERLVMEARAMARLSHPNVVAVYDVERSDDGDMIVMEYVEGGTVKHWLAQLRPWTEIVGLFVRAGRGLAAAHAAELLHRDFKPGNVLVGPASGGSLPTLVKVTDFGVAKGVPSPSTAPAAEIDDDLGATNLTEAGTVMGTPRYMSPEQHSGEALDPATDQYAFCIALWEALDGEAPFVGGRLAARKRKGPPRWSNTKVPSSIGAALVRGLAPDPEARWPDMDALLEVLSAAIAPRRSRWISVGAFAGVLSLAAGAVAISRSQGERPCEGATAQFQDIWGEERREAVRDAMRSVDLPYAEFSWTRTRDALDQRAVAWIAMHRESCEATTIRGEQSEAVMDMRMRCLHRVRTETNAVVSALGNGTAASVENAYDLVDGLRPISRCADIDALHAAVEPPSADAESAVQSVREGIAEANALRNGGRFTDALAALESLAPVFDVLDYPPVHAEFLLAHAQALSRVGDVDRAGPKSDEAIRLAAAHQHHEVLLEATTWAIYLFAVQMGRPRAALRYRAIAEGLAEESTPQARAEVLSQSGLAFAEQGLYVDAETLYRDALREYDAAAGAAPVARAQISGNLATALGRQGKYEEAEELQRRNLALYESALGPDHPTVGTALNNLGNWLTNQARHDEAERELKRALEVRTAALGPQHAAVADTRNNLAIVLLRQKRLDQAEVQFRAVIRARQEALPENHPGIANGHNNLAAVLLERGDLDAAEVELRFVDEHRKKHLPPKHPHLAGSANNLAMLQARLERFEEAEAGFRRAIEQAEAVHGPEHPEVAGFRRNLARMLVDVDRLDEAGLVFEQALQGYEASLDSEHLTIARTRLELSRLLRSQGKPGDAVQVSEIAWTRLSREPGKDRARGAFELARALSERGVSPARVEELASVAEAEFKAAGNKEGAENLRRWRAAR